MSQNTVSITITPEQVAAVRAAIAQIEAALPGLISLEPARRKKMRFMAQKSTENVRATIRTMAENPEVLPRSFSVEETQADLAAYDILVPLHELLVQLTSRTGDTVMALGSDLLAASRIGYQHLKLSGDTHGLEDMRKQLGERFAKQGKRATPAK